MVNALTPPAVGGHRPCFTWAFAATLCIVFFFMTGQFGMYRVLKDTAVASCMATKAAQGILSYGPGSLKGWIAPKVWERTPACKC